LYAAFYLCIPKALLLAPAGTLWASGKARNLLGFILGMGALLLGALLATFGWH